MNFFIKKETIPKKMMLLGLLMVLCLLGQRTDALAAQGGQQNLPVIWSKTRELTRPKLGPVVVPFWQQSAKTTNIFGLNSFKSPDSDGNYYIISASDKVGTVSAEHQKDRLILRFYDVKTKFKKSQTDFSSDPVISDVKIQEYKSGGVNIAEFAFALRPVVKDFVISLDELGERVLVEMITNAVIQVSLADRGDEELLMVEGFQPLRLNLRRGAENTLEIEVPSAQSLLADMDAEVASKYISRMAVSGQEKGKTKVKLWLRENTEFAPEGQGIRFFAAKTKDIKYAYGILSLKRPENFDMSKVDYLLDIYRRKASLSFPHEGYLDGAYWIADDFVTKVEAVNGRLEFTFPSVRELTIAEDRDRVYISAKKPKEIFTKVVFIDIGHGGNDPGAARQADIGMGEQKYLEKDANFALTMQLKAKLEQNPAIRVYYSRLTDENPSAYERARLANETGADFFLSLHHNMTTVKDRKIEGTDVYYLEGRSNGNLSSKRLSELILQNYAKTTTFANRLILDAPHLYMVKYPKMPAVIVESGFMSDDGDLRKMFDPAVQERTAQALYDAIVQAFAEI